MVALVDEFLAGIGRARSGSTISPSVVIRPRPIDSQSVVRPPLSLPGFYVKTFVQISKGRGRNALGESFLINLCHVIDRRPPSPAPHRHTRRAVVPAARAGCLCVHKPRAVRFRH